jgi:hypothetical protein
MQPASQPAGLERSAPTPATGVHGAVGHGKPRRLQDKHHLKRGWGGAPPPVPPLGDPGWMCPPPNGIMHLTPQCAALHDRDAPQPPAFLPTPSNLLTGKQAETCDSLKACALMLLNLQRDALAHQIQQYESTLAEITRLQDELAHPVYEATVQQSQWDNFGQDAPSPQDCPALRPQALFAIPQVKISADDPFACNSTTSVLAASVDSIQGTTCTMVGKPLALPLSPVQTHESDTPSGYCSNPHVPTVMITPNATTPATGEPVSNSVITKIRPGRSPNQSKCLMQMLRRGLGVTTRGS